MQPSQAPNETRLPRAVVKRSAAIAARYAPPTTESEPAPTPQVVEEPSKIEIAAKATTEAELEAVYSDPNDPRKGDWAYWKQRALATTGILAREREAWKEQTQELHQKISELQTEARNLQAKSAPEEIDLSKFFTPEEIERYGEPQCRVMAGTALKAANSTAQERIDAAVRPLQEKQENDRKNDAVERERKFFDRLTELYPNWQTADNDQRWRDWLSEEDETGVQRQAVLEIHKGKANADACAKMFKLWEKTLVRVAPPVTPSGGGAAPSIDAQPPNAEAVAALVAPTNKEVRDFYARSAMGKVKDDERVKFEARLKLRQPQ